MPFMTALDMFCGAGGATKGLSYIFTHVTGIDSKPQFRYCGNQFIQGNALSFDLEFYQQFDFIWASPPCQAFVPMAHRGDHHDLIAKTRALLTLINKPWVIENIPSAPLPSFITLCGTMDIFPFLRVVRHRRFESNFYIEQPAHLAMEDHPPVYSFDRRERRMQGLNEDDNYITCAGNNASLGAMSDAMGIHWMTRPEISQAVPPVYAKYIAKQFIKRNITTPIDTPPLPHRTAILTREPIQ
jgi:DNA (cytosine-5)-methyltransferase 1